MIKQLLKRYGILSIEMESAIISDNGVINTEFAVEEYVDDPVELLPNAAEDLYANIEDVT